MIRIGIVGTGFARAVQLPGLRHVPGAQVTAIASGTRGKAAQVASEHAIPFATDDWRELVKRDDVDLVFVETPPDLHRIVSEAALAAGKRVLCEKPMSLSASESVSMASAAKKAGRLALVHHELRWDPGYRIVRERIADGSLGRITTVQATMATGFRLIPEKRWTPLTTWNWWSDASRGGGMWGAVGSHVLDLLRWWLGEAESITGVLSAHQPQRPDAAGTMRDVTADDQAHAVVRYRSGAVASIVVSGVQAGPRTTRFVVAGERARLVAENESVTLVRADGSSELLLAGDPLAGQLDGVPDSFWARGFVRFARDLVAALGRGEEALPDAATFDDGLAVQRLLDAVRK